MKKDNMNIIGALKYMKPFYEKLYLKFFFFYIGRLTCMLEETLVPILVAIMINQMVYYRNIDVFIKVGMVFLGVSVFSCIVFYMVYEIYIDFWGEIAKRVRSKMYQVVLHMNAEDMANANYGDLSQQIQWKTTECGDLIVKTLLNNVNCMINIGICLFVVYKIDFLVGVVFTIMVPISVWVTMKFGKKIRRERKKNEESYGTYINWLYEIFGAFRDIRLMNAEEYTKKKFNDYQDNLIETDVKAGIAALNAQNVIDSVNVCIRMILYVILAVVSVKTGMMIGTVTIILKYFNTTTQKLHLVCENYMIAQWRLATLNRLREVLEIPLENDDNSDDMQIEETGEVLFENVSFAYRNKENVIDGFNLHIRPGEKVALVGESGCGKTTLSYMLLGFYPVQKGKVYLHGRDVNDFSLKHLRHGIGVVQQEALTFEGTVRENVKMGNPQASDDDMIRACKAAGVYEFVSEMENGFDTLVGNGNRKLSGGQKQRIAIARAYLKNPSLLIFDEATASLDKETEKLIHENWATVLEGKTALVITHRLSAAMLCDRVVIMEHGRIVEEGIPSELYENSMRFRRLFAVKEGVTV